MIDVRAPRIEITESGFSVLKEIIKTAEKYVCFVSFLFYDEKVADLLIEKCRSGVSVELLTTPPEAAGSSELKEWSSKLQERLESSGVKVVPCEWEVGQPERTVSTFAGGRRPTWYALHTKFLVTDKHAVVMSADLTKDFNEDKKWDSFIIYDGHKRVRLLQEKYELVKNFFTNLEDYVSEEYIDSAIEERKLLKGYPFEEAAASVKDGFHILPLDAYGRHIVERLINDSEEFIYCVYETIYDDELSFNFLKKMITSPHVDFRILSPPLTVYQQNPLKARTNFVQLAAHGAEIKNLNDLRAKIMITDKAVLSGSFDLSVMGVGRFRREKGLKLWVGSTEIMDINTDKNFISQAKLSFLKLYERASKQYGKWFEKDAGKSLRSAGATRIAGEAKESLGLLIFNEGRKSSDRIKRISVIAVEIARLSNKNKPYVMAKDILGAEQILLLKERSELDSETVCKVLGLLEGDSFLRRLEELL